MIKPTGRSPTLFIPSKTHPNLPDCPQYAEESHGFYDHLSRKPTNFSRGRMSEIVYYMPPITDLDKIMQDAIYLLIAAAVVGIIHMSAPDHWVTLAVLGRSMRWNRAKLAAFSLITGAGHSAISVALGFLVVAVGLIFSSHITYYVTESIGIIMIAAGLYVGMHSLLRKEHSSDDTRKGSLGDSQPAIKSASYFAVLGAALSPDLSILPIFLASIPMGWLFAVNTAVIFVAASILTMLLLVLISSFGVARAFEKLSPKYNDSLVGFIIAAVGAYVLIFG